MKALEKLQESYERESELARKHKKKADELKQKIDEQKALALQKKTQELQLTPDEYERLLTFLSDKASVMSALSVEEVEEAIRSPGQDFRREYGEEETTEIGFEKA